MLRIMLLHCLLAIFSTNVALARPGFLHGYPHLEYPVIHPIHPVHPIHPIHHPEPLHIAKIIHVPAAISHQSSTVIHSAPHHIIKPIVVPVVKTIVHPVIKTYHPAPIFKAYHPEPFHIDPFHHHHHDFHHYH